LKVKEGDRRHTGKWWQSGWRDKQCLSALHYNLNISKSKIGSLQPPGRVPVNQTSISYAEEEANIAQVKLRIDRESLPVAAAKS